MESINDSVYKKILQNYPVIDKEYVAGILKLDREECISNIKVTDVSETNTASTIKAEISIENQGGQACWFGVKYDEWRWTVDKGICRYLDKESDFPGGWTFTVKSNKDYPHAIFYNYSEKYNETESIGILLGLSAFIIEYYKDCVIYEEVLDLVDKYINMMYSDNLGDMGATGYISLVNAMKKTEIDGYDYDKLEMRLKELVDNTIQKNPEQWPYYGYRPSDYIKSPDSMFYSDHKDIVNLELDFLVDTLPENDVWPISWSWFDNNELYPKESKISEMWAKAGKVIERSLFLRNFGRVL